MLIFEVNNFIMNNINYEALNVFVEGLKIDWAEHVEDSKTYQDGWNGRLYSHNGVVAFSSVKGTKKIYENDFVVKYNGFCAFDNELILFCKADRTQIIESGGSSEGSDFDIITKENVRTSYIDFEIDFNQSEKLIDFDEFITIVVTQELVATEDEEPLVFNIPFSEVENSEEEIDLTFYYEEMFNSQGYELCDITEGTIPPNNLTLIDCIFSLTLDENGNAISKLLWSGNLNIHIDAKIVTFGVFENNFYKRVYFTDYSNPFRVINLKDDRFPNRKASEFSTFQNVSLLRPQIVAIKNEGQIPAGTVMYTYRLITQNGQTTGYSPLSDDVKILANDSNIDYAGGDIAEITSKSVEVRCNLVNFKNFKEVELIALEFQANGSPTAIRSLGLKKVASVVKFTHYGNEPEFDFDLKLSEILERKNTWNYCSDISSKSNLLIAAGLRNEPLPGYFQNVGHLFSLHAWDNLGATFNSYINPDPEKYKFIYPQSSSKMYTSKRKMYTSIQSFESFNITLKNKQNNLSITHFIAEKKRQVYEEYISDVWEWLNSMQNSSEFISKFPGVKVELIQRKIVFSPINPLNAFDFSNIIFGYSSSQIIEDFQDEIVLTNLIPSGQKINGFQSLGFNQGTGIRITFNTDQNQIATKANAPYPNAKPLIDLVKPTTKRYFFKGEIYRPGIQIWLKDGSEPFVIPIGDIKIPDLGEKKSYLDGAGNIVNPSGNNALYRNSFVEGDKLYAEAIYLDIEVRLSCEIQDKISMYQIVYVERTEDNRTILCQGMSGPLQRVNPFFHSNIINIPEPVNNKWALPLMGGPNYDNQGLIKFDENPNEADIWRWYNRVVTHRSLFYFDAPDIIFNIVSAEKIKNGKVIRLSRLNPDMRRESTYTNNTPQTYPAFSRKIPGSQIVGGEDEKPYNAIFSMFLERPGVTNEIKITKATRFNSGEIKSGNEMETQFSVSNYALTLAKPNWFYLDATREDEICNNVSNTDGSLHYELMKSANVAAGNDTVIIKTTENVFTNEFINQLPVISDPNEGNKNKRGELSHLDTHALINIKMNNSISVYGGRSELSYSKNVYAPLSDTIPVLRTSSNTQRFKVFGDTYSTLFLRTKTFMNDGGVNKFRMENHPSCRDRFEEQDWTRKGAWAYAVVLETSIEPRWTSDDLFYKNLDKINFSAKEKGMINEAYFQKNNLRNYIPKPYNFKDDPNLSNIIAVSDPKMSGDTFDSFSSFQANNFYEVEKDKGTAFNLAKYLDKIFVIQENQTSELIINENVMVNTSGGEVGMKQGTGNRISGHNPISDFGTSIRRAVVEAISSDQKLGGFTFIDEKRFEWLKSSSPKLVENNLQLKFREIFEQDPIVDTEGYYDDEYKETNIRIRTKSGKALMLSYNERFQAFNGFMEIDSDIFFMFDNKVIAPKNEKKDLHLFNSGTFLEFFDDQKSMRIKTTINVNPQSVKIFKAWAGTINIDYPVKKITVNTSTGQQRIILGEHIRYQIQEGVHNVPLKNEDDWADLRGEWATIEVEIESKNNQKVDVFSFLNFVRHSNQ